MPVFKNQILQNQDLDICQNEYHDCKLINCNLIYDGTAAAKISNIDVEGEYEVRFTGLAAKTIDFMRMMHQGNMINEDAYKVMLNDPSLGDEDQNMDHKFTGKAD